MFLDGGDLADLLPEVKKMSVVACGRIGLFLGGTTLHVALEDTRLLYEQRSSICSQCRNKKACRDANKRHGSASALIEEVICLQAGSVALSFLETKPYFGETNPTCITCSHMTDCLAVA